MIEEDITLFSETNEGLKPLAERMRPKTLDDLVGQENLVGPGKILQRLIEQDEVPSMIFWGPPGSGKTTLAGIIALTTGADFIQYSAVEQKTADIRKVLEKARVAKRSCGKKTILFVDEIHRFNKAQQAIFLPFVESGEVILIGATTENPSFEVISPLLSRCRVFIFNPLSQENIGLIIKKALSDKKRGLGKLKIKIAKPALDLLIQSSNGDARNPLNALESAARISVSDSDKVHHLSLSIIEQALQYKALSYDKAGDEHYNVISAFIKSMRGSDPDAALYWLARMLEAGEDPKFIARRMVIFASEDITNRDPMALLIAIAAFKAVEIIGLPEAQINLAQAVTYLATAPKSNASYKGLLAAKEDVQKTLNLPVPLHLRNAPTQLMKEIGYGKDYEYSHNFPNSKQEYLPKELKGRKYYEVKK